MVSPQSALREELLQHAKTRPEALLRYRRQRGGMALFIVLSILVVLSTLIIAFMSSTRSELVANDKYSTGEEVRALAEAAVHLTMSQIREASLVGIDTQGRGTHIWASQPGAIRVWDDDGVFVQLYKLYSSASLKADDLDFIPEEIPDTWRDTPDLYVDLNQPVAKHDGTNQTRWVYPILNPAAIGLVDGFNSTQSPSLSIPWDTRTSMPVRWLYVNRDGSFSNTLTPDSTGRVAFWTDDDSSKVNINTAGASTQNHRVITNVNSGGSHDSYWDTPHTRMNQDYNFGRFILRQDEFQRYPGHPATVNLLAIIKAQGQYTLKDVMNLTPRYRWGGSTNGTVSFTVADSALADPIRGIHRKMAPLYASVDELRFALPTRSPSGLPPATAEAQAQQLDLWRFFLTAHSRAPDLNPFGQPRVSLWPITEEVVGGPQRQTIYDRLIAFCTTVGAGSHAKAFHFKRINALSQTEDWTGFPRNQTLLMEYLHPLTSRNIPGFGGSFETKYEVLYGGVEDEWKQILTEMFDWIRCVNLMESADVPSDYGHYTTPIRYSSGNTLGLSQVSAPGAGVVLPIVIADWGAGTRGAGRVPLLSEVGYRFLRDVAAPVVPEGEPTPPPNPLAPISAALNPETFSPMAGPAPWMPKRFQLELENIDGGLQILGEQAFPDGLTPPISNNLRSSNAQNFGGVESASWIMLGHDNQIAARYLTSYPFKREIIPNGPDTRYKVTAGMDEIEVQGGDLRLTLHMDGSAYQRYNIHFPATTTALPIITQIGARWTRRLNNMRFFQIWPEDVAKSVSLRDGDFRTLAYIADVPKEFFVPSVDYEVPKGTFAHSFQRFYGGTQLLEEGSKRGAYSGDYTIGGNRSKIRADITDLRSPAGRRTEFADAVWEGDVDNGFGYHPEGAYLGKSDEGWNDFGQNSPNYFDYAEWNIASGFFSPTKQAPSAVVFGSLPTGVKRTLIAYSKEDFGDGRPWRTLLFCPNPHTESSHFGFVRPADHLLLDFFHLPVVEPYAISEPLSTAGRINMNSQILPFTSITRESGLHAILSYHRVTCLNNDMAPYYNVGETFDYYRYRLNIDETLWQFRSRFAPNGDPTKGDLFRSPSEITRIFLVPNTSTTATGMSTTPAIGPNGATWSGLNLSVPSMTQWWRNYTLTGNNMRERPYALIYPLLTTRSNTYTVHYHAQTLVRGTNKVTGEYRGSSTIERYIDPVDPRIGTEVDPDTQSLEPLYRFRVIDTKRFAP